MGHFTLRVVSSFQRNQQGSVAILFGLMVLVTFGVAGISLDYSRAVRVKSHMQVAADMAVLSALRVGQNVSDMDEDGRDDGEKNNTETPRVTNAKAVFAANFNNADLRGLRR